MEYSEEKGNLKPAWTKDEEVEYQKGNVMAKKNCGYCIELTGEVRNIKYINQRLVGLIDRALEGFKELYDLSPEEITKEIVAEKCWGLISSIEAGKERERLLPCVGEGE